MDTKRRYQGWANPQQILYHGTTRQAAEAILTEGIDPMLGDPHSDFGRGFYTTTNRDQAEIWAAIKASAQNGMTAVVLEITLNRAALARLRHLAFVQPTEDYWSLVKRCRDKGDQPYSTQSDYDVVYGPVARRWWGKPPYKIDPKYDQTSFHGKDAKALLNDKSLCKVEEAKRRT